MRGSVHVHAHTWMYTCTEMHTSFRNSAFTSHRCSKSLHSIVPCVTLLPPREPQHWASRADSCVQSSHTSRLEMWRLAHAITKDCPIEKYPRARNPPPPGHPTSPRRQGPGRYCGRKLGLSLSLLPPPPFPLAAACLQL